VTGIPELARLLSTSATVGSFDSGGESEAWALAHALIDMRDAFETINHELLERLVTLTDDDAIHACLLDIGEELRHVLYHIDDSNFFAYLRDARSE
jgi:hypothetical protein